jgi:hypothetical protein
MVRMPLPPASNAAAHRGRPPSQTRGRARMRLREIMIIKTWLPKETLKGRRETEVFRREQVRMHFRILERFRTTAL